MFNKIYKAFYLSLFIAAVRKIVDRFTIHPASMNDYHVVIPFCEHCIIAGRYRSLSVAERAKRTVEAESGYICQIVQAREIQGYVAQKCSGSSSSIFDDDKTRDYLSLSKRTIIRAFVHEYEAEN